MSLQERRPDEQKKQAADEPSVKTEMDTNEVEIVNPSTSNQVKPQAIQQEETVVNLLTTFYESLPDWVNKPFTFVTPTHPGLLNSWLTKWKELIIDYARITRTHVVYLPTLQDLHPFTNQSLHRKLEIKQLQQLIESLIEEERARWLDEAHLSVRVYFITAQQLSDEIKDYLFSKGYAAEVLLVTELHKLGEDWSALPDSELIDILQDYVDKGDAKWINKDKTSLRFIIK